MKKIIILFIIFFNITNAQNNASFFVRGKDTIYAKKISYKVTMQSYLKSINYETMDDQAVELEGKKNLTDVTSFCINGKFIDKIPQKANKPESYVCWAERVVDGKLKIYYYSNTMKIDNSNGQFMGGPVRYSSLTRFFMKMPDGTFYDITDNSDRKKIIIPYLTECSGFNSTYKGKFDKDNDEWKKLVTIYNSMCK